MLRLLEIYAASAVWLRFVGGAGVSKDVVAHIQCAVCKQAVKEASTRSKDREIDDEDELTELVDGLCSSSAEGGKWTTRLDIYQKPSGAGLSLDRRERDGVCETECKTVQRACTVALKGKDDTLVTMLKDRDGVGTMQTAICKKACKKEPPELKYWMDEPWAPAVADTTTTTTLPPFNAVEAFTAKSHEVVSATLKEFGETASAGDLKACVKEHQFRSVFELMQKSEDDVMGGNIDAVRGGLGKLAEAMEELGGKLLAACDLTRPGAERMVEMAKRLIQHSKDPDGIEYKPKEVLKVGGHDLHKSYNNFLSTWSHNKENFADGPKLGELLGKLFLALDGGGSTNADGGKEEEL